MSNFLQHIKEGLSKTQKELSSMYFYDESGDKLFQEIMQLEEYYLPACEMEIIQQQSELMAKHLAGVHKNLQIIELGAGDGSKTKHLLNQFKPYFDALEYVAMDISENILFINKKKLNQKCQALMYAAKQGIISKPTKIYPKRLMDDWCFF